MPGRLKGYNPGSLKGSETWGRKRDLPERNSVGLREGEVLLMQQREKSLGQREAQETGYKEAWFEISGCRGWESGVSRKRQAGMRVTE